MLHFSKGTLVLQYLKSILYFQSTFMWHVNLRTTLVACLILTLQTKKSSSSRDCDRSHSQWGIQNPTLASKCPPFSIRPSCAASVLRLITFQSDCLLLTSYSVTGKDSLLQLMKCRRACLPPSLKVSSCLSSPDLWWLWSTRTLRQGLWVTEPRAVPVSEPERPVNGHTALGQEGKYHRWSK